MDQTEQQGKDIPDLGQRRRALGGRRAAPTFSPASTSNRLPNRPPPSRQLKDTGSLPPLNQQNSAHPQETDRILRSPTGLIGTTITISTKTGQKYEGVVSSTSGEGGTAGVTLKDVEDISVPGTPVMNFIFIASANIDTWVSGPAVKGDFSRTGTEDAPNPAPGVVSGTHNDNVTGEAPKRDTPEGPVHDPNSVTATPQVSTSIRKISTPAISTGDAISAAFHDFVSAEKQRLVQMRQPGSNLKLERDKLTQDLAKFSQTFKLKESIPGNIVLNLTKDEGKQEQIRDNMNSDIVSENARATGRANIPPSTSGTRDQ